MQKQTITDRSRAKGIVRWGFAAGHMRDVARFIGRALTGDADTAALAADVAAYRRAFSTLAYVR